MNDDKDKKDNNNNLSLRKFLLPHHNYFLLDPKLFIGISFLFVV